MITEYFYSGMMKSLMFSYIMLMLGTIYYNYMLGVGEVNTIIIEKPYYYNTNLT